MEKSVFHSFFIDHLDQLIALCKRYEVETLYAFGSVVSGHFDPDSSDIDLIVYLSARPPVEKGEALLNLWDDLETLFQRKVDLLTDQPIRNPYLRENIEATKQLVYERESEEVPV